MRWLFEKMHKSPKGLRYKLLLAFSLMSIIPLLACTYLVCNYVFPQLSNILDVSSIMFVAIGISILGLGLARGMVDPVIDMAVEAKIIASGEYNRKIMVSSDDEVGNLGDSINVMTQRIKNNLDELKSYGQKTREINTEIHKKVLALSSLLQIGDIIATGSASLDTILDLATQKVGMIFDTGYAILYLARPKERDFIMKASYNADNAKLANLILKEDGNGLLEKVMADRSMLVIDESVKPTKAIDGFKEAYGVKNLLAVPICSGRRCMGLLVICTSISDFRYKTDDTDLIKVFAKQITIAIENAMLMDRAEELAIIDELTGLFNKNYILTRLEEEIRRAIFYQRPCSFIVFNIDNFKAFREAKGQIASEEALKRMAKIIKDNTTPVGKAARIAGDEFAILLPEKNKKAACDIAEDVRKKVESSSLAKDGHTSFTVSAGISENPIDGSTREELFKKALEALNIAKSQGKNKVAV